MNKKYKGNHLKTCPLFCDVRAFSFSERVVNTASDLNSVYFK